MKIVRAVKSKHAVLCLDCETIYSGRQCPCCASQAAWPIAKFMQPPVMAMLATYNNEPACDNRRQSVHA